MFDEALRIDPLYARAYNNMGNAFQATGDFETAAAAHGQAILLAPGLASAYSNLGNALRELGENVKAVEALTSAVALNPAFAAAYTNLGSAMLALGDAPVAARWHGVAAALTRFSDPSSLNNFGAALEASGRLDEAGMVYERAIELQPGSAVLHINRGNVQRRLGLLTDAVQSYSNAISLEPDGADTATAYNNVAAALQAEGELERAMEAYDAALELHPTHGSAKANRDKLPISQAYRAAAGYEGQVLASRAARARLAIAAAERAGAMPRGQLARASAGDASTADSPTLAPALHRVIRYLRRLETKQLSGAISDALWYGRASDMPKAITTSGEGGVPQERFTLAAFAWGGVWYQTLATAFTHPECRMSIQSGGTAVVLGSSIGFEAYFVALTYGVPTVGIELLCSLTSLSEDVREVHRISPATTRFECADALDYPLPRTTSLVYVDDTAWDEATIYKVAQKLGRALRKGAIVVHNREGGYEDGFRKLQTYAVGTSWNPEHPVHVHVVE